MLLCTASWCNQAHSFCHLSISEELPSRWTLAGQGLQVPHFLWYNRGIITREFLQCSYELLCRKPSLQELLYSTQSTLAAHATASLESFHPAHDCSQEALLAKVKRICWSTYLGSPWCRWKDNAKLNNNLARSSQNLAYLFFLIKTPLFFPLSNWDKLRAVQYCNCISTTLCQSNQSCQEQAVFFKS